MKVRKPRKSEEEPEEIEITYTNVIGTVQPITTWSETDVIRKDIKDKRIYGFIRPKNKRK